MKRSIWLPLLVLLGGPGCLNLPKLVWDEPAKQTTVLTPAPPPPAPVQPEDVNESNYLQMLEKERAEIDHEEAYRAPSQVIIHKVDGGYRP